MSCIKPGRNSTGQSEILLILCPQSRHQHINCITSECIFISNHKVYSYEFLHTCSRGLTASFDLQWFTCRYVYDKVFTLCFLNFFFFFFFVFFFFFFFFSSYSFFSFSYFSSSSFFFPFFSFSSSSFFLFFFL